jgi:hypothetical protein
MAFLC